MKLAGLMLAGLIACASGTVHAGTDWQALHERLTAIQSSQAVPSMVLVILDRGRPVLVAATGRGTTAETPYRWGSITKTLTALTMLQLLAERGVPLTDTVAGQLSAPASDTSAAPLPNPLFENPWEAEQPLRLVNLLELTAGLPDLTASEFNDNTRLTLQEALARNANQRRLLWPPGLQHSYSNVPPGIAAAVIERISGEGLKTLWICADACKPREQARYQCQPDFQCR